MKKGLLLTSLAFSLILGSCNMTQYAKFTSVENVYQLRLNSNLEQVITTLGSKPYNVYSSQIDGYTIYTYKYKVIERIVNPKNVNKKGGETAGNEVYNGKEHTLFLFFKNDKLESFVTSDGRKDSPSLIVLNNTLYSVTKDKDKYIIVPTTTSEEKDGFNLNPFKKKK